MGFGKTCLSALVVSVVVAWTTNATAEVAGGVILRVTVHATLDGADLDRSGDRASCLRHRRARACCPSLETVRTCPTRQLRGHSHSSMPRARQSG